MRRKPQKQGVSLGTVTMLALTGFVVVGCFWLFPKLFGDVEDFQFDASQLAVSIDVVQSAMTSLQGESPPMLSASAMPSASLAPLSTAAPPVSATKPTHISFSFSATGTIGINTAVQNAMTNDDGYHFSTLFEDLRGAMSADLAIATLKNTVNPAEKPGNINLPAAALSAIRELGVRALCLGHPDILNSGIQGLVSTQEAAHNADMLPYGVYASQAERDRMTVLDANGVSIGLLNYQNDLSATGKRNTTKEEQAFTVVSPTLPTIASDIQTVRAAGAQVVIVSLCWGRANATSPTRTQLDLAQSIADAGADIILGTHSGAVQPVSILTATRADGTQSTTLCAYSLGNLFTHERERRTSISGILLHATVTYELSTSSVQFTNLSYTPTYVWRGREDGKTLYRVLPSNSALPAYMQEDQLNIMKRCFALIETAMKDSTFSLRAP